MKLKNILFTILAGAAFAACTPEGPSYLNDLKVDCSYVTLPDEGGSKTITVTANSDWEVIETPEWLTASPAKGSAGETKLTFTATALSEHSDNFEADFFIACAAGKVGVKVIQGTPVSIANTEATAYTPEKAIELFLAGRDLGAEIYVKGVVTKASIDLSYGNAEFYLEESNADYDFEFYRCLDFKGEKFTDDQKVKKGDTIIAKGTLTSYKSTIELAQGCQLVKIVKAPIDLTNADELNIPKEGGEVTAKFVINGSDFRFDIKDDFLSVKKVITVPATYDEETGEQKTPEMTGVVISAPANEAGAREGQIDFTSDKVTITATVKQEGAIAEVTVADFLAAEEGTAEYKVTGIITKVAKQDYGNIYIKDATGELYVYGVGSKGDFTALGLKEGDIVTLQGQRSSYNGTPKMKGGQYVTHKAVTTVTAAEVPAMADEADKTNPQNYIRLTGVVTDDTATESGHKFDLETYGNFALVDESGSIYVYGVTTGWGGATKQFGTLGVKEGDTITIVAYKTSYKGAAQVIGMYVSHTPKDE